MGKDDRLKIIKELQNKRGSVVITYVTGDRSNLSFQIAGDTPRRFFDHLLRMDEKIPKLDLFIYSVGGDTSVPWRIISLFREFADEINVLVPFRAYSAATLLAIGADHIFMGKKGELGPIDPAVLSEFNPIDPISKQRMRINVEDITSYITFLKDKVGLQHQPEIGAGFNELTKTVNAVALGYVNRHYNFIRMVAKKMLQSHKEPLSEARNEDIMKELIERIYFHGHGIARKEAKDLGLKIETPSKEEEDLMWKLYLEYEKEMLLNEPFFAQEILEQNNSDNHTVTNIIGSAIESEKISDLFITDVKLLARRQIPEQLQVNVNFQVPEGVDPNNVDQELLQRWQQTIQQLVHDENARQAPIIGIDTRDSNARWERDEWK